MKFVVALILIFTFSATVQAGEADPVQMAKKVGFIGCDNFIRSVFEFALKDNERLVNISSFPETKKEQIRLLVTFGSVGETIYQAVTFTKRANVCYSMAIFTIKHEGTCVERLLTIDKDLSFEGIQGDFVWNKSKSGVLVLMQQVGPYCVKTLHLDQNGKLDS